MNIKSLLLTFAFTSLLFALSSCVVPGGYGYGGSYGSGCYDDGPRYGSSYYPRTYSSGGYYGSSYSSGYGHYDDYDDYGHSHGYSSCHSY